MVPWEALRNSNFQVSTHIIRIITLTVITWPRIRIHLKRIIISLSIH